MINQLGVAILGSGYWGINYIRVFNELPQSDVALVCDKQPSRLQEIKKRFPDVASTTDFDELLQDKSVDVVTICTPASTHYELTKRCLEAGKHVLVEKPLTIKTDHAEDLVALAKAKQVTLMVGHTFLYNASVRKVKSYLETDKNSRIYYLYAQRTNLGPIRQDVNALWDLASHDVSIFNYLLDSKPLWISATGSKVLRKLHEDVGFVTLGYQDGVVGHIHVSWADPNKVREVVVVSSNQRIVFDDTKTMEPVRIFEKGVTLESDEAPTYGEYRFLMRDGNIISPKIEMSEPLKNQCSHFIDCVLEGKQPLTDGQSGVDVVQVMEAIDQSMAQNGIPIQLS